MGQDGCLNPCTSCIDGVGHRLRAVNPWWRQRIKCVQRLRPVTPPPSPLPRWCRAPPCIILPWLQNSPTIRAPPCKRFSSFRMRPPPPDVAHSASLQARFLASLPQYFTGFSLFVCTKLRDTLNNTRLDCHYTFSL